MALWGDQDHEILKVWEWERIMLTAHRGQFWLLRKTENVSNLYGEPVYGASGPGYVYDGPIELEFAITYQEQDHKNWNVAEQGIAQEYDAECFVSRIEWERAMEESGHVGREPEEGDIIYGMGYYWDVSKADRGGYIIDQDNWVGFRLELKKTKKEDAVRKLGIEG